MMALTLKAEYKNSGFYVIGPVGQLNKATTATTTLMVGWAKKNHKFLLQENVGA